MVTLWNESGSGGGGWGGVVDGDCKQSAYR